MNNPSHAGNIRVNRLYFAVVATILVALTLWGFAQFYLHGRAFPGRPLTPPIRTLIIAHAATMTAWMALLLIQSLLIVGRQARLHMMLGKAGAVLAAGIVVLGAKLGIEATRLAPTELRMSGLTPKQFLAVPIITITAFAVFVGLGLWQRRRPQSHRAMMLLATLAAVPAAVARIDPLNNLYVGTAWETAFGPFLWSVALLALLLILKRLMTGAIDRWYAVGSAALAAVFVLTPQVARTETWDWFAGVLLG